ncbi:hypothetical protein F4861DRAFT_544584 [Xylaria intraflava]|nr:hypothetical protein F4861DRAFT_544584 [Xylaria intraflava]
MDLLQEPNDPDLEYKRPVNRDLCCNRCNIELGPVPRIPPKQKLIEEKPHANSFAAVALGFISAWCTKQAQDLAPGARFDIIGEMFMEARFQYAIARQFSSGKRDRGPTMTFLNVEGLVSKVPFIREWEYFESRGEEVASMCFDAFPELLVLWRSTQIKRAEKRAKNHEASQLRIGITSEERRRVASGTGEYPRGARC